MTSKMPAGGTAANMALNAFRSSVDRSRTRELGNEASQPRSVASGSRRLSRGTSLGRNINLAKAAMQSAQASGPRQASPTASSVAGAKRTYATTTGGAPMANDVMQSVINSSPGCFTGDDGSSDISDRYNFFAHGKRFLFATCSLGVFDEASTVRHRVVWFVTSKFFDRMVLILIAANSVLLAIVDLDNVDEEGEPESTGLLRNTVVNYADTIFTTLFSIECSLKIVAMGLFGERGAYLMDPWNWIDFAVVGVGLVAAMPGVHGSSGLRAFRVLRPLRFFNAVPSIKKLVTALLKSIPELLSVVTFISFLFFLFGVIGVQLWSGTMHARCRLTPFPLALDPTLSLDQIPEYQQQAVLAPELFRCLGEVEGETEAVALPVDNDSWVHKTSPWHTPRVCFWPVDEEATPQLCNLDNTGERLCPAGQTCGSDYDRLGNLRFTHPDARVQARLLRGSTYVPELNFGLLSFDHVGQAAMVLFICMTREGWADVMYMLEDAGFGATVALYFLSFVLMSSYFMLNLALAVIWENFSDATLMEAEERKLKREIQATLPPQLKRARSVLGPARTAVGRLVTHWSFTAVSTALILLNTVLLSLDQYPADEELAATVDVLNFALTLAFLLEVVLKFIGLGRHHWLDDRYNLFDVAVVTLGVVEAIVSPPSFLSGAKAPNQSQSLAGLRSLRIFRLFKLARSWPSLQKLLVMIASAVREIGNFSVLLFLFLYVYALLGMQMFGNRFRFDASGLPTTAEEAAANGGYLYVPRANFDSLLWSGVTVFQVLTGENWTNVLLDGWRATGWASALYFVSLVVFGNFIVLNLFLAILLSHFEDADAADQQANGLEEKEALRVKSRVTPMLSNGRSGARRRSSITEVNANISHRHSMSRRASIGREQDPDRQNSGDSHTSLNKVSAGLPGSHQSHQSHHGSISFYSRRLSAPEQGPPPVEALLKKPQTPQGQALFLLGPYNPLRRAAWDIVHHPRFDGIVLGLVAASTVCVALDNPLADPESTEVRMLGYANSILAAFFVLEVVLKVVAHGFCLHPNSYLRDGWNVMDFVITAVAVPGLQSISSGTDSQASQLTALSNLKVLRALRPLRMIHRNPGLKLVVSSLVTAIPQMLNVGMLCFLLLSIFSILAVNNLKGRFFACAGAVFDGLSSAQQQLIANPRGWTRLSAHEQQWFNASAAEMYANASAWALEVAATSDEGLASLPGVDGITSHMVCDYLNASWGRTIPQSFDNVVLALRTFFEISTTEGWVTLMLAGVDATDVDMQPVANNREAWVFFFIAFIFLGSFFFIQLFIGVVIENFNRMKETLDGTRTLSASQREWLLISEGVLNLRPMRKRRVPRNMIRRICFRMALSPTVEIITIGAIMLNTFVMALTYFGEEDLYTHIIEHSNVVFVALFTLEAAVKIVGLGRYYWKESWNIFDFVVVVGSYFGMLFTLVEGEYGGSSASTIRSVRVLRLMKLVQTAPSLRQLVNTLMVTLPSLVNIGGFLLLVLFIYAAVGVQLFAKVKLGELVTPHANFQSISRAMITLMRCATGERWNDLMHELASTKNCVENLVYDPNKCGFANFEGCVPLDGCGSPFAFVYFCTFTMSITFVLLNIFIAVILEGFANEKDRSNGVLLPQHYENFVTTWSMFDPEATGMIEWHVLPKLVQQLDEPLGFGQHNEVSVKELTAFIEFLNFSIYNGNRVFFSDVARKLGKFVLDVVNEAPVVDLPSTIVVGQKWRGLLKGGKARKLERYRLNHIHAAVLLHDAVRSLIFRDELKARVNKFTDITTNFLRQRVAASGYTGASSGCTSLRTSFVQTICHEEIAEPGGNNEETDTEKLALLSSKKSHEDSTSE